MEHLSVRTQNGGRFQSGVPTRLPTEQPTRARGLMFRAVVVATFVLDDETHPQTTKTVRGQQVQTNRGGPVAVYCDVITYGSRAGSQTRLIKQCLVLQRRGGLHDGDIWLPKATTQDNTGQGNLDRNTGSNSSYWDGDHVLVGFMDDNFDLPIILGGVPHPTADAGVESQGDAGQYRRRMKLRQVDGHPDYTKHHGSYYGIDNLGNHTVDTRFANDGTLDQFGAEAAPPGPSEDTKGNQALKIPSGSKWELTLEDMTNPASPAIKATLTALWDQLHLVFESGFELLVDDSNSLVHLGDGSEDATVDKLLQAELERIKGDIDNLKWELGKHRHPVSEFPAPIFFVDVVETFRQPALYSVKTQPPINIRTSYETTPDNALQDIGAGSSEYFGLPTGPSVNDVLPGGSAVNATKSNTVKLKG